MGDMTEYLSLYAAFKDKRIGIKYKLKIKIFRQYELKINECKKYLT